MGKKVVLPESKLEVELPVLSWDDTGEVLEKEKEAGFAPDRRREYYKGLIEQYFPEGLFDKIKGANRDVLYLMSMFNRYNFGAPEEEKN